MSACMYRLLGMWHSFVQVWHHSTHTINAGLVHPFIRAPIHLLQQKVSASHSLTHVPHTLSAKRRTQAGGLHCNGAVFALARSILVIWSASSRNVVPCLVWPLACVLIDNQSEHANGGWQMVWRMLCNPTLIRMSTTTLSVPSDISSPGIPSPQTRCRLETDPGRN